MLEASREFVAGTVTAEVTVFLERSIPEVFLRSELKYRKPLFFHFSGYLIVLWTCGKELETLGRAGEGKRDLCFFFSF